MRIGLDIMGGDYAPEATTLGAIAAMKELPSGHQIVLIGDKKQITGILQREKADPGQFEIVHADEVIGMSEHPTKAIGKKPNSSINIGFKLLKDKAIDSFASAGNTGAMLVGAIYSVKTIPGIIRPSLTAILPKENGGFGILLDVGANADCKPDVLVQFGVLGSLYAEHVYGIQDPKVALLNIGEEEEKGNMLTQAVHSLMKNAGNFNFAGNIEGRDLFNDKADVVVCDGFTGNVVLKMAESFYMLTRKRNHKDEFFERFNYENYGGSAILGVNAPVIIGHGISNPKAIKNMLLLSADLVRSNLSEKIQAAFN